MTTPHGSEPPNSTAIPLVKDIFGVSADFLGQLRTWFEQNPPAIPVSQIIGFNQFTANSSSVSTSEATASTSYTDLATVGPQVTGLPDGKYIVLFGCTAWSSGLTKNCFMSVKYGAAEALDSEGCINQVTSPSGISRAVAVTLAGGGNNTIKARYKSDAAATATFTVRWLVAIRYAN